MENNVKGLGGSGSHAAWNLRPLLGFVALRGLLQYSVSPSDLNFPLSKCHHGNFPDNQCPVVNTPHFHCRWPRFDPWSRN